MSTPPPSERILNINVGVLGHVDSGKTSLVKALSTTSSTACFDKNPQSQERGITIDLGFSSFSMKHSVGEGTYEEIQFTLVDCPGHASLIRTIIGGASIMDLMILVVDVNKGIQTQTAECLVLGEITFDVLIVALNKVDSLPENERSTTLEKMKKRLGRTLNDTKFRNAPIVPVSAKPSQASTPIGIEELKSALKNSVYVPQRNPLGPLLFSVDHCFSIRGQGTIMTGTVLQGTVCVNDNVEISSIKESRKVKSIQMFRKPVKQACQGDRVGLCVKQFDSKLLERGIVSAQGVVPVLFAAVIDLNKISYYKGEIRTKAKFHISLGHETVLARITLFGNDEEHFSAENEFVFIESYRSPNDKGGLEESSIPPPKKAYCLLEFEKPISVVPNCRVLGSKLDLDVNANACRLAFYGGVLVPYTDKLYASGELPLLRIFKSKSKEGIVERISSDFEVICKSMFKKETSFDAFTGLKVRLSSGETGMIEGRFGKGGKFKVRLNDSLSEKAMSCLSTKKKKPTNDSDAIKVYLNFKKYIFDPKKKIIQN